MRCRQVVGMKIWETMGGRNLPPRLGGGGAPVLVIHGEVDPIPVESPEAWARAFPDARLLLVEDSGHLSHVERPGVFFAAVETFLEGGWPPAAKKLQGPPGTK